MGTRLYADEALRVLWLTKRRQELALSAEGVWLRMGRHKVELRWQDVQQVQLSKVPLWPRQAWVDVFTEKAEHRVGPFPREKVVLWLSACGAAVRDTGRRTIDVSAGAGFAVGPTGPIG